MVIGEKSRENAWTALNIDLNLRLYLELALRDGEYSSEGYFNNVVIVVVFLGGATINNQIFQLMVHMIHWI